MNQTSARRGSAFPPGPTGALPVAALLATILLAVLSAGCGKRNEPGDESAAAAAATGSPGNAALLAAASPLEDLTESALADDGDGMSRALATYDERIQKAAPHLSDRRKQDLDELIDDVRQRKQDHDNLYVALDAVEAYRILVEALDSEHAKVPREVSLLDYDGFRTHVLLREVPPDWPALGVTAAGAREHWNAIRPRLAAGGLRDAVDTAVEGLNDAVERRDIEMTGFAAQVVLDLVDLLESRFESAAG